MKVLQRNFYERDTVTVARELLGKRFIRRCDSQELSGSITETEAYRSDDEACHAYRGLTKRTASLFGPVGHTYVYLCYGIHYCLNIVARDQQVPAGGVLIRAISLDDTRVMSGPGKTGNCLSITTEHNGLDVTRSGSSLIIFDAPAIADELVQITPRIGLSKGTDQLWRFYYDDLAHTMQ